MSDHNQNPNNDEDFESMLEASFRDYNLPRRGEIRTATILQIEEREIIVDLGAKQDGIVPYTDIERMEDEYKDTLKVGEEVPVYVINPSDSNNNLIVSINMGLQRYDWENARKLLTSEDAVDVTVTGYNKGGLLVRWRRLEGFIPSSHLTSADLSMERRDAMAALMHNKLGVKVIEVDQDRRRLIFSEREAQREWRLRQKARLLDELQEGDKVTGYCYWPARLRGIRQYWRGRWPHPCE